MLRFTFLVIFLISFLILSIPVLLVEAIIGKFNRKAKDYSCLRIVQWGFRCILWITGVETTVIGEEQVPDEPVLFVGNHRSYFDILLTYSRCKRLTGYVAKKEMERFPLLNNWMRNRSDLDEQYCRNFRKPSAKERYKGISENPEDACDY